MGCAKSHARHFMTAKAAFKSFKNNNLAPAAETYV
jgi:hypothetical protein